MRPPPQADPAFCAGWLQALSEVSTWLDDYRGRSYVAQEISHKVNRLAGGTRRHQHHITQGPPPKAPRKWSNLATARAAEIMLQRLELLPAMRAAKDYCEFLQHVELQSLAGPRDWPELFDKTLDRRQMDELVADTLAVAGDAP